MVGTTTRLAIVLPGLHRVNRGAETAFESVGREIAKISGWKVTLFGSGPVRSDEPYEFVHVPCVPRERFERRPRMPMFRSPEAWEELSFVRRLRKSYSSLQFDATLTCSYAFCNWFLRAWGPRASRPAHVFVTQNGDWPCFRKNSEFRWFGCDGLICTNPEFYERHRTSYPCSLIPNGVDPTLFRPDGTRDRAVLGIPTGVPVVLIVSALIPSKRVLAGIEAASKVAGIHLVVAGNGPLRDEVDRIGNQLLGTRFHRMSLPREQMPSVYRCADALLHMSVDEPSANAYIEALATGLPIITHDREVTRWTLGTTSYLTDTLQPNRVTDCIRAALEEPKGSRTSERMELVSSKFTWSHIASQYCDAILAAVGAKSGNANSLSGAR